MPDTDPFLDPLAVGLAARTWDEHHVELRALAARVGVRPSGFSPAVAAAAHDAALAAELLTDRVGSRCEELADGLRATLADWVRTDQESAAPLALILGLLVESR